MALVGVLALCVLSVLSTENVELAPTGHARGTETTGQTAGSIKPVVDLKTACVGMEVLDTSNETCEPFGLQGKLRRRGLKAQIYASAERAKRNETFFMLVLGAAPVERV